MTRDKLAAIARLSGAKWQQERIRQSVPPAFLGCDARLLVRSHLRGSLLSSITPLRHWRECAASRRNIKRNTLNIKQRDTDLRHLRRCQCLIGARFKDRLVLFLWSALFSRKRSSTSAFVQYALHPFLPPYCRAAF